MSQQATVVKMPLSETSKKYLGINIDTKRDELLSEQAKKHKKHNHCTNHKTYNIATRIFTKNTFFIELVYKQHPHRELTCFKQSEFLQIHG